MIYFISDNHWGHNGIIKMSNRKFDNVHHMNLYMIEKWNEVVGKNDEVYYLGDFMYKMNPRYFTKNVLDKLNGKIYLLIGNHDERYLKHYLYRLEWAKDRYEFVYNYQDKNYKFILDHYPLYSWKGMWRKSIHLHGHTHKNTKDIYYESFGNKKNVNCEFYDYKPLSIIDIINEFKYNQL